MNTPEADMLDRFIQVLIKTCNAKFWCEVKVPGIGTADAVGLIKERYFIFEGKAKLSYGLLAQCMRWRHLCSSVEAVVPYTTNEDEETSLALEHFRSKMVGVVMVGQHVSYPVDVAMQGKINPTGISEFLRDSQLYGGKFARSGASGGRRGSKANEQHLAIETWIRENPGLPAKDSARAFGMKAAKILKLIKDGKIKVNAKEIGGISHLYHGDHNEASS